MMRRAPFAENSGVRINQRQHERCSDGAKYKVDTAAVPLRTIPEKSESSRHKDELWKRDSDKLAALMAEAEVVLNPTSKDHQPPSLESDAFLPPSSFKKQKLMVETVKLEKRARNEVLATSVVLQNLDKNFSGRRLKVSSRDSMIVKEEKAFGSQTMWEESEDKDNSLSPAESNLLQTRTNYEGERAKPPTKKKLERLSSLEFDKECRNSNIDQKSGGRNSYIPSERFEHGYKGEQDDTLYFVKKHKDIINWDIVQHDRSHRCKVKQVLKLFEEEYFKLLQEHSSGLRQGRIPKGPPHIEAAGRVKAKRMAIVPEKDFGHIPGIEIGDEFSFRAELTIVGLNSQFIPGIDFVALHGKRYATSVVDSGRYENEAKEHDILIYSGEGGNPKISVSTAAADQKPVRGNRALMNSMEKGYPVRVIQKRKRLMESKTLGMGDKRDFMYVYDGLYNVNRFWEGRDKNNHKLVFKFELQRLPGQPSSHGTDVELGNRIRAMEVSKVLRGKENLKLVNGLQRQPRSQGADICVLDDISQGKEKFKVRVVNRFDGERPLPFTYITNICYPPRWCQPRKPVGCNCIDGCSDSVQCCCAIKNGGMIPFTQKGELLGEITNKVIHECGSSCKCPPSCMNRVGQRGLQFQLEIFKTKSMGWGVRSRDYIMPGSFICEYIGELIGEKEVNQRIGNDEYLFDICHGKSIKDGFALDATKFGNIGRFLNHSCDPNVVFQEVLYDHDDKSIPRIMCFASKRIPPRKELTFDYKHFGNIKMKACYCGSCKCTGRLN